MWPKPSQNIAVRYLQQHLSLFSNSREFIQNHDLLLILNNYLILFITNMQLSQLWHFYVKPALQLSSSQCVWPSQKLIGPITLWRLQLAKSIEWWSPALSLPVHGSLKLKKNINGIQWVDKNHFLNEHYNNKHWIHSNVPDKSPAKGFFFFFFKGSKTFLHLFLSHKHRTENNLDQTQKMDHQIFFLISLLPFRTSTDRRQKAKRSIPLFFDEIFSFMRRVSLFPTVLTLAQHQTRCQEWFWQNRVAGSLTVARFCLS